MLLHPPPHVGENLCVAFKACIHAAEGAQALHDHVGLIAFCFKKKRFWWGFDQPVSPSGRGLGAESCPGVSWGQWLLTFFLITFIHLHAPSPSP
jgi:hypothetical protein